MEISGDPVPGDALVEPRWVEELDCSAEDVHSCAWP